MKDGRRWSAEEAYIRPVRNKRRNLFISTHSKVLKILVDPDSKTAYGVEYKHGLLTKTALAKKEVILSAGAYSSPQILMLSGIGPKAHLEQFQIPVIQNAPVGEILHDHIGFFGLSFTLNETGTTLQLQNFLSPSSVYQYLFENRGPLTSTLAIETVTFLNTNLTSNTRAPDIECLYFGGNLQSESGFLLRFMFNLQADLYNVIWGPLMGVPTFLPVPMLLHPKSKGRVRLRSSNPWDTPKIYANYFMDPQQEDMKVMVGGIRAIQRIVQSKVYEKYDVKIVSTPVPKCADRIFDSDEYWRCALMYLTTTIYHPHTSCKMGPRNDSEAVVDSKLKVHGIKRLRVIDASVIPTTISGHLNVPCYMIGEKGSDLIKDEWLLKNQTLTRD